MYEQAQIPIISPVIALLTNHAVSRSKDGETYYYYIPYWIESDIDFKLPRQTVEPIINNAVNEGRLLLMHHIYGQLPPFLEKMAQKYRQPQDVLHDAVVKDFIEAEDIPAQEINMPLFPIDGQGIAILSAAGSEVKMKPPVNPANGLPIASTANLVEQLARDIMGWSDSWNDRREVLHDLWKAMTERLEKEAEQAEDQASTLAMKAASLKQFIL